MKFVIVARKIFTWDGKLVHERHTRRFYDPDTRVGFILENDKRLPLNIYGDFGIDNDCEAVRKWEEEARIAYNLMQAPEFMHIEVI